jgi:hypothetical protein
MNVSRQTFGRIIESARRKMAEALVRGKALRIEGGDVQIADAEEIRCPFCRHAWKGASADVASPGCPRCRHRRSCRKLKSIEEEEK